MTINEILALLLNSELAENDDLPCKAISLKALAITELAKLSDLQLNADQQEILTELIDLV
jgi:hypothetical protein